MAATPSLPCPRELIESPARRPALSISSERSASPGAEALTVNLQFDRLAPHSEALTVTADVKNLDIQNPDPAQRVLVRDEILDANPGRPGAPVSIPGLPIETASSGIKAPQYFAPGVAGDHGEPIATFIQVGSFLVPNNLSANAHGNGYSDPNIIVPAIIESVQTDGGAFNVREGNHSVDLAATYALRPSLEPFATLTADYRDVDLSAGWRWLAVEASFGNGFLETPEHRRQYKINAIKGWDVGAHRVTALFLGYYGESKIPGLVPIGVPNLHDTIDPRQRDQTHTGEIALNDVWHLAPSADLQLSSFFRTYNLSLDSNFGDGLIRQSEFRTVTGGNANYIRKVNRHLSLMAGLDYFREAPRRDDLDRYSSTDPSVYGPFTRVTANDITLNFVTPFVAIDGNILPWLRYNLGWRRDQVGFDNADLLHPANSFNRWVGINSPKATLAIVPPEGLPLPSVSFSFGQTFFTNDPRIGTGTAQGSLISQAHAYQLVVAKTIGSTDFRVTLGHITQEASLAKIDPDTGLQFDEGPSRNRYITASARHYFRAGLLQASRIQSRCARSLRRHTGARSAAPDHGCAGDSRPPAVSSSRARGIRGSGAQAAQRRIRERSRARISRRPGAQLPRRKNPGRHTLSDCARLHGPDHGSAGAARRDRTLRARGGRLDSLLRHRVLQLPLRTEVARRSISRRRPDAPEVWARELLSQRLAAFPPGKLAFSLAVKPRFISIDG